MEEDVLIQIGLGRFFAAKLRSGVLFEIYSKTGNVEAGKLALAKYQEARGEWASVADRANNVYHPDITYGNVPMRRGSWVVRLPGIDGDLGWMRHKLEMDAVVLAAVGPTVNIERSIQAATGRPTRPSVNCAHTPPTSFHPGQPLSLSLRRSPRHMMPQCCPSLLSSRQSGRALAIRGNATQPRWIRCYHSRGLHEFRLPLAVLLRASARNRGRVVLSGVQLQPFESTLLCDREEELDRLQKKRRFPKQRSKERTTLLSLCTG